ncbi:hypothetical protein Tco_0369630 [Tanacetum coccineum]
MKFLDLHKNLRNFSEAWDVFKELLRACPHHGFTELTQVDTFYNGLNENEQDSINAAAGGNILSKTTREALNIIENKSKVCYSRNRSNASRMNATSSKTDERIDKLADQLSTLVEIVSKKVVTLAPVKAVEETCVTCGGAHSWYKCPTTDNNQASVCETTGTYNQVNPPNRVSNQMAPPELLLKLMDDLQILKGSQQEKKETVAQSFTPNWNFSMIDDEEARDNFLKDVCTFLRKFSRIPFGVTPKVILIAWERFGEIKDALTVKQYQQEDIQELMSKLLEDMRNIREELSEYINCPSWNRPTFYDNDDDEYTIIYSKPKANELIKYSVENLVPILSEFEGISNDRVMCPCEDLFPLLDALNDHLRFYPISSGSVTSSDDDDFEGHRVSPFSFPTPRQRIVISDNSNDPLLELPEFESFHFDLYDDPSFPRPPPEPSDVEISLIVKTDAPVMKNFDELNGDECFDPGGDEIDVEDDDSFTFVIRTFLPFLTDVSDFERWIYPWDPGLPAWNVVKHLCFISCSTCSVNLPLPCGFLISVLP